MSSVSVRRCGLLGLLLATACAREDRRFGDAPTPPSTSQAEPHVQLSQGLQAGASSPDSAIANGYEANAWAVSEGQKLYNAMNCSGCHSPRGGGNFGPSLMDSLWIYGSDPENINQTLLQGRPRGMPSFKERLSETDRWKLVAFVRSLSGLTRASVRSGRSDALARTSPSPQDETRQPLRDLIPPESKPPPP